MSRGAVWGMDTTTHSVEVRRAYRRVLAGSAVHDRFVEVGTGDRVHVLATGDGPPLVLLHGTGGSAGYFMPLLNELHGVHALAPDRPGQGLSDPIDLPRDRYREATVAWLDRLFDVLEVDTAALLGHSGGGVWALWYALARPDRVKRLVLVAPPALPKTRCPLPVRLILTPGVGDLLYRSMPSSPKSVLRFARLFGDEKIADHPDLVDLEVAAGRDSVAAAIGLAEVRTIGSPFALLSGSGFRRRMRVQPTELRQLAVPTLLVWGEREPLGGPAVARAAAEMIPDARLEVLPAGHTPWLGHPDRTAALVAAFVSREGTER